MTEATQQRSPGELKQLILRIYNAVNQSVSGMGVRQQRVDLLGDRILVVAEHQRIRALAALDDTRRQLTREVDVALIDRYKHLLKEELEAVLGVGVRTILKDYDPVTQLACTLVVLDADPTRTVAPDR
jgi:hypothetical protein